MRAIFVLRLERRWYKYWVGHEQSNMRSTTLFEVSSDRLLWNRFLIFIASSLAIGGLASLSEPAQAQALETVRHQSASNSMATRAYATSGDPLDWINREHTLAETISIAQTQLVVDKAFPLLDAKWPNGVVFVCWEQQSTSLHQYQETVRLAVLNTWQKYSALEFVGWNVCSTDYVGVRIAVRDEGPHVKHLGKYLAYDESGNQVVIEEGMVLNFSFENWSPDCRAKKVHCIRAIAVHEFGHAIGFAHEHNREDTPGECRALPSGRPGDTYLTPWDPDSVMNYCNDEFNNNGELSDLDIVAVRAIYGNI
ncbi:MAG: hypothetical protein AAFY29_01610 [Pseudomonadota bacterium]